MTAWSTVAAETLPDDQAWSASVEVGRDFIGRAFKLFAELLEAGEPSPTGRSSAEILIAGTGSFGQEVHRASNSGHATAVADLAFIAKLECRQLVTTLAALQPEQSKWIFIEACQRARRRVLKALTAVGRVIRELVGDDRLDDVFVGELSRSLSCRSVLASFWERIASSAGEPTRRRLRLGGTAIAMLQGSDAYYDLRLGDRLMLRELHGRIIESSRANPSTERAEAVLLQDLEGFVSLTRQINRRAELVEHDGFVAHRILSDISAFDPSQKWRVGHFPKLSQLAGLSDNLDRMLVSGDIPSLGALRTLLEEVAKPRRVSPRHMRARTGEFETASLNVTGRPGRP